MGYHERMAWEVEYTDQFGEWYEGLDVFEQDRVISAVGKLEQGGPALGRPFVDSVKTSRHSNMKELRPLGGNLRILFAFDPRRMAILLLGGDKTNQWNAWYEQTIPLADRLYDDHLIQLELEGLLP